MKRKITNNLLRRAVLLTSLGVMTVSLAQASTNYFDFDADPVAGGLAAAGSGGDNGTLGLLAGAWMPANGSPNEPGVGDQSTNGYWAITQTTPTNTYAAHGMHSALIFNEIDPGYAEAGFTFACDVRIGGGSVSPADGFSVSFARNSETLASMKAYTEQGTGNGLAICFDAWAADNTATGIPGLVVKVDGTVVTTVAVTTRNGACGDATSLQTGPTDPYGILHATDLLTNLCWQPLWINLDPSGLLSVSYKGVSLLSNYALPAALSAGKFVLSGRTGGSWQEQDVDNLTIITVPSTKPVVSGVTATRNSWSFRIFDSGLATPDTNTLTVTIDGVAVAPNIAQSGNIGAGDGSGVTTVSYLSASPLFFSATTHTNVVHFTGSTFTGSVDRTNTFFVPSLKSSEDRVRGYSAKFFNLTKYGVNGSGRTGAPGDYALDVGNVYSGNNSAVCTDPFLLAALNAGCAGDQLTISFWMKRRGFLAAGGISDVWLYASQESQGRGLNLHLPYTQGNISNPGSNSVTEACYYDTGGTAGTTQRISTTITNGSAADFDGTTNYWLSWRHVVLIKNGGIKQVWLDGQMIPGLSQASGASPMRTDMTGIFMGSAAALSATPSPSLSMDGFIDDFAFYTNALSPSDIASLYSGTAPNLVSGASSLIAWWDFNDAPSVRIEKSSTNAIVTFSQILQSATDVRGPYSDMFNATSPYTNNTTVNPMMFFRTRK